MTVSQVGTQKAPAGTQKAPETSPKAEGSAPKIDDNEKTSTTLSKVPGSFAVAADFLEKVCARASGTKYGDSVKNLARWINPDEASKAEYVYARDSIITDVIQASPLYIGGLDAKRKYYKEQLDVFIPVVEAAARKWAHDDLLRQSPLLARLSFATHYQAERLHVASAEVRKKAKSFVLPVLTSEEHAEITNKAGRQKVVLADRIKRLSYMKIIGSQRPSRQTSSAAGPDAGKPSVSPDNTYEVLYMLMVHPRGVDFIDAYARSAADGRAYAADMINESSSALVKTDADLTSDKMLIWHLPTAVSAGAATLGLAQRPNLTKVSLAWATTQKGWVESSLDVAMNAIMVLDLVGGPIGVEIGAVLNVVLAAIGTAVSFLEDVQQDQAASATAFGGKNERLSEGSSSIGTILQGVATIVAAAALPGVVSRVTGRASARIVESGERLPVAKEFDPRVLDRSLGTDAASVAEAKAIQNSVKAAEPEAKALQKGLPTAASKDASAAEARAVQSGIDHAPPEAKALEEGLAGGRASSSQATPDLPRGHEEAVKLMREDPDLLARLQKADPLAGNKDPAIELAAKQKVAASAAEYRNVEAQANLNRSRGTADQSGRERLAREQPAELHGAQAVESPSTALSRERPNSVPEPPILDRQVRPGNYSKREVFEFYQQNLGSFPRDVRNLIDGLPQKNPSWTDLQAVDKAIRDSHTELANRLAGVEPNAPRPFINSVRGASNEGGRVNRILTDDKRLTLVGRYSGGTAEFDSVEFSGARIIERKLSLNWTGRDGVVKWVSPNDIFAQMLHQSEFVDEWRKWSEIRWIVHDYDSYLLAQGVHSRLEAIHPRLSARMKVEYFE